MLKIDQCIITVTRACNLRCSFCYAKNTGYKADEFIDFASLTKLIDFCSDSGVNFVVLTGGEPMLYPKICEAIRYIKTRPHAMTAAVPTNGVLLLDYDFCRKVADCGLNLIPCSMFIDETLGKFGTDFSSPSELESYTRSASYKGIMTSLNMLPSNECDACANKESCLGGCPCFWEHCTFEEFMNFKNDADV